MAEKKADGPDVPEGAGQVEQGSGEQKEGVAALPGEVDPAVAADANDPQERRILPDGTEVSVERNSDVTEPDQG